MKNQDRKFNDTFSEVGAGEQIQEAIRDIELTIRQVQENPNRVLQAKLSTFSSACTSACFSSASTIAASAPQDGASEEAFARIHEETLSDS